MVEIQVEIIEDVQKKKLLSIVLEKTDAKTRLKSLRQTLLEFKEQKEKGKEDADVSISSLMSQVAGLDMDIAKHIMELMHIVLKPLTEHYKLTDSIAEVIRSSLSDEDKIEKISDLLL